MRTCLPRSALRLLSFVSARLSGDGDGDPTGDGDGDPTADGMASPRVTAMVIAMASPRATATGMASPRATAMVIAMAMASPREMATAIRSTCLLGS